jgi:hypothetical protein
MLPGERQPAEVTGSMARDDIQREVLPIPDRPYAGPIVYEAKDPAAKYPSLTTVGSGTPSGRL